MNQRAREQDNTMALKAGNVVNSAPAGSCVWCCPATAEACCCCSGCYNCCHKCRCCPDACRCGPPCPRLFFWLPCCCCCCRPVEEEKKVEVVVQGDEDEASFETQEEEAVEEEEETAEVKAEEVAETPPAAGGVTATSGPRRRVVLKKGGKAKAKLYAAKSQPKMFTGAAAGCPPPPAEACVGSPPTPEKHSAVPLGEGIYLVYKDKDEGGTLYMHWSRDALQGPGILAYVKPTKEIADFKFSKKNGLEKLCSNLQQDMQSAFVADRRRYYEGWATFVKLIEAYGGTVTLLPASDLQPPPRMRIVTLKQKKLQRAKVDTPLSREQVDLVAIVPDNATKFDVDQMEPGEFSALARNYGAFLSFMPEKDGL